jgi:hypothetical protein
VKSDKQLLKFRDHTVRMAGLIYVQLLGFFFGVLSISCILQEWLISWRLGLSCAQILEAIVRLGNESLLVKVSRRKLIFSQFLITDFNELKAVRRLLRKSKFNLYILRVRTRCQALVLQCFLHTEAHNRNCLERCVNVGGSSAILVLDYEQRQGRRRLYRHRHDNFCRGRKQLGLMIANASKIGIRVHPEATMRNAFSWLVKGGGNLAPN